MARALAHGRRRAATRLTNPGYEPHPRWRHFIDDGWRVVTTQAEAFARVQALVDAEDWRGDRRTAWTAILQLLVACMDWHTGLICAVTAARLGAAGGRAERTVSRVIAWARDIGLLVVVEHAASAEFLGTPHGRTPTYALVTHQPATSPSHSSANPSEQVTGSRPAAPDLLGDLPISLVDIKPLRGRRQPHATPPQEGWPLWGIPTTPAERNSATACLLGRLGLDRGGVSRVPQWRARALLRTWWDAGASPAGLLHAMDHHPDHPQARRGALRGARDPLRVLGARLRPWRGRLHELPARVVGLPGDYRRTSQHAPPPDTDRPTSTQAARAAARAALEHHLRQLRASRKQAKTSTSALNQRCRSTTSSQC